MFRLQLSIGCSGLVQKLIKKKQNKTKQNKNQKSVWPFSTSKEPEKIAGILSRHNWFPNGMMSDSEIGLCLNDKQTRTDSSVYLRDDVQKRRYFSFVPSHETPRAPQPNRQFFSTSLAWLGVRALETYSIFHYLTLSGITILLLKKDR